MMNRVKTYQQFLMQNDLLHKSQIFGLHKNDFDWSPTHLSFIKSVVFEL